jgi:hypothetical protein
VTYFSLPGPPGTHAHEHYHPPFGPDEYQRVLTACVTDYESALLFLDVALEVTACGVGTVSGLPIAKWRDLVKLAEESEDRISESLTNQVLYLQRVMLYARNYAIAHPGGQLATVSHDNVGNIMYWRVPAKVDTCLLAEADELLHKVRPEIVSTSALTSRRTTPSRGSPRGRPILARVTASCSRSSARVWVTGCLDRTRSQTVSMAHLRS